MSEIIQLSSDEEENGRNEVQQIEIVKTITKEHRNFNGNNIDQRKYGIATAATKAHSIEKVQSENAMVTLKRAASTHKNGEQKNNAITENNEAICCQPVPYKRQKIMLNGANISLRKPKVQQQQPEHKNSAASSSTPTPALSQQDIARYKQFGRKYRQAQENRRNSTHNVVIEEDFSGQFECTYQNCGKYLRNNICLMWHLWAHVVHQKPTESEEMTNLQIWEAERRNNPQMEEEEITDVKRLHICPECLLSQPTPHRIQLHYRRVHKKDGLLMTPSLFTCNICETVIGGKDIAKHVQSHYPFGNNKSMDLPYACRVNNGGRRCGFRVSSRAALIDHFVTVHRGTTLLCPFCLNTFAIPPQDRKKNRIKVKEYVQHVLLHDTERTLFCTGCVTRYPQSHEQALSAHKQQHTREFNGHQQQKWLHWPTTTKDLNDIKRKNSKPIDPEIVSQQCVECGMVMRTFKDHYTDKLKNCTSCTFATNCKQAFLRHQSLSSCNPKNIVRWPFGQKPQNRAMIFRCSPCQSNTCLAAQAMEEHARSDCKVEVLMTAMNEDEVITQSCVQEKKQQPKSRSGGVEEEEEEIKRRLNEFLPSTQVRAMADNKHILKHILAKKEQQEQCEENDKILKIFSQVLNLRGK